MNLRSAVHAFLKGMGSVMEIWPVHQKMRAPVEQEHVSVSDALERDAQNLRSDRERVCGDLARALRDAHIR